MNLSLFKTLKDNLINGSNQSNRSIIELCITELSSGNFPKAVDLSEELIKKDINDSVGWVIKALSQAHVFDYDNNLFFLKSSLTSLDEFKNKTSLSTKEVMAVEAIFVATILDRTIILVTERVEEVVELRRKAIAEKTKAKTATIGAVLSAYAGSQSKSDVGKILGYGGAIAGVAASSHFNSNAEILINASKGIFGVAVANISMTVGSAVVLKKNLDELNYTVREEATEILKNWIHVLISLYKQVILNLLIYIGEIEIKFLDMKSRIDFPNKPEVTQFIYLSKILGIDKTNNDFLLLEEKLSEIRNISENDVERILKNNILISFGIGFGIGFIGIIMFIAGIEYSYLVILLGLIIFVWLFFVNPLVNPPGELKNLRTNFNEFKKGLRNFKITSENIEVSNINDEELLKE